MSEQKLELFVLCDQQKNFDQLILRKTETY